MQRGPSKQASQSASKQAGRQASIPESWGSGMIAGMAESASGGG